MSTHLRLSSLSLNTYSLTFTCTYGQPYARIIHDLTVPHHSARCMVNLGGIYKDQARFEMAQAMFEEAICTMKVSLGPDHVDVARSLCSLAGILGDLY